MTMVIGGEEEHKGRDAHKEMLKKSLFVSMDITSNNKRGISWKLKGWKRQKKI